jgi:cobalamin biosynthetic protein CobC
VVDEAFIDVMPTEQSYSTLVNDNHVLVLRSFGKFFGLAGIRIGFLIANSHWCETFAELLGPWQVNNPAQIIAEQALADKCWQEVQKTRLNELRTAQEKMLKQVLSNKIMLDIKGWDLFLTVRFHHQDSAKHLYHLLCQQAVYCRLADEQDTLRFGIVITNSIKRLEKALQLACTQLT